MINKAKPTRNAEKTKQRILDVATQEFARHGIHGSRVDTVAEKADVNKGMIYHYFKNKEDLFIVVLENAYKKIRAAEIELHLEEVEPIEAIRKMMNFTWDYYIENPEFLSLVSSENLNQGQYIKQSEEINKIQKTLITTVENILEKGKKQGLFYPDIDAFQLCVNMSALGYYYLVNKYTMSVVFKRDLSDPKMLIERKADTVKTILRSICIDHTRI